MKKILIIVCIAIAVYLLVSVSAVAWLPCVWPSVRRAEIINTLIALLGAVSTLSAVLWALFSDSFFKMVHKSNLELIADKDDSLCYLIKDEVRVPDIERTRLEICAKISNGSLVAATGCQLVTNELYVSSDGIKFSKLRNICTAAFKWVYEDDYETTIRRGVDKFARIVDIRREVSKPAVVPGGKSRGGDTERVSLVVRVPDHTSNKGEIDLGVDYKGVMFPVKLVSETEEIKVYFLQIVWQGKDLKDFKVADKLKIRKLDEAEAKRDII